MSEQEPVQLGGARLDRPRHACGFFYGPNDEYDVLVPFIQEGLQTGHKAFLSLDPGRHDATLRRLQAGGVDVEGRQRSGQLEVVTWESTHLRPGRFDQDAMLALIEGVLIRGKGEGYPLTRLIAHMEWALEDVPGVHDIVEYETRLSHVIARHDDAVICTYDATRFGGGVIVDILRTHPLVIVGGFVQENPFYVPPDQLLAELRARTAREHADA
jgi:hypothetical protein